MRKADRRTAGLIVVAAMALFLGGASIMQRLEDVSDAADAAQSSAEEVSDKADDVSDRLDELESRIGE